MLTNKQKLLYVLAGIGATLSSGAAQASLSMRGAEMVYDDVLNVTWLKDTNYAHTSGADIDGRMTWDEAKVWVADLRVGGYSDWRLPTVSPIDGIEFHYDPPAFSGDPATQHNGDSDNGYNITSTNSELAYMFHVNLNNQSKFDANGVFRGGSAGIDWGLTNTGLFDNLQNYAYWFEVEHNSSKALAFNNLDGRQNYLNKANPFYAWAVRSGDVTVVPVPATVWLMGSALLGLTGLSRKR